MEINKFQMKRVSPFQGLVIDADTWKDAHNYHRENMKLHIFAFHKTGIVRGLEITASNPPDASVNISPGIAVDPEGNSIVLPQPQRYHLQTHEKRAVYLVIQFREIPSEPFQPPEGGQPTRIMEAYRVQERDTLPSEPYVELARIDYDPAMDGIKNARNTAKPVTNEINLRFREEAAKTTMEAPSIASREPMPAPAAAAATAAPSAATPAPSRETARATETMIIGYLALGEANKALHKYGLSNLVEKINRHSNIAVAIDEEINPKKSFGRYSLIYLTGSGRFELTSEQQSALLNYQQSGGVIFADGCSATPGSTELKGAKEFGLAFNRLASQFNCKLGIVQRGHPLLSADHVFSEVPPGCEPPMLLEGGNMICNSSDYGCAWEGGHADKPLPRETIRCAMEIGANILFYAFGLKTKK
jgi:hypothetical protein